MNDIKGFVTFEGKQYPFSFSDEILNLYPDKFDPQSLDKMLASFERGKTIENILLHGITLNRKNIKELEI